MCEVGKALVTIISNFVAEGLNCSVGASSSTSIDRRLRIFFHKKNRRHSDAVQLTEEIGCSVQALGACEK
jgi:hypothetical protein